MGSVVRPDATARWSICAPVLRFVVALAVLEGCDGERPDTAWHRACEWSSICGSRSLGPETIDLIDDPSVGSSGTTDHFGEVLDQLLRRTAARPGSRLRVWVLARSAESVVNIGERVSPKSTARSERSRAKERERWIKENKESLLAAAQTSLSITIRRSPIAETLARVALANSTTGPRTIIFVSDGREMSDYGSFECRRLPSPSEFAATLRRANVLPPGRLQGVRVVFAFMRLAPVGRCSTTIDRETRIREIWTSALKTAGASSVAIFTGLPDFALDDARGGDERDEGGTR